MRSWNAIPINIHRRYVMLCYAMLSHAMLGDALIQKPRSLALCTRHKHSPHTRTDLSNMAYQKPFSLLRLAGLLVCPNSLGTSLTTPIPSTLTLVSVTLPPSLLIICSRAFAAPGESQPNS